MRDANPRYRDILSTVLITYLNDNEILRNANKNYFLFLLIKTPKCGYGLKSVP